MRINPETIKKTLTNLKIKFYSKKDMLTNISLVKNSSKNGRGAKFYITKSGVLKSHGSLSPSSEFIAKGGKPKDLENVNIFFFLHNFRTNYSIDELAKASGLNIKEINKYIQNPKIQISKEERELEIQKEKEKTIQSNIEVEYFNYIIKNSKNLYNNSLYLENRGISKEVIKKENIKTISNGKELWKEINSLKNRNKLKEIIENKYKYEKNSQIKDFLGDLIKNKINLETITENKIIDFQLIIPNYVEVKDKKYVKSFKLRKIAKEIENSKYITLGQNINIIENNSLSELIIVEGFIDYLSLKTLYKNISPINTPSFFVMNTATTALSFEEKKFLQKFKNSKIVSLADNDNAGKALNSRIFSELFNQTNIKNILKSKVLNYYIKENNFDFKDTNEMLNKSPEDLKSFLFSSFIMNEENKKDFLSNIKGNYEFRLVDNYNKTIFCDDLNDFLEYKQIISDSELEEVNLLFSTEEYKINNFLNENKEKSILFSCRDKKLEEKLTLELLNKLLMDKKLEEIPYVYNSDIYGTKKLDKEKDEFKKLTKEQIKFFVNFKHSKHPQIKTLKPIKEVEDSNIYESDNYYLEEEFNTEKLLFRKINPTTVLNITKEKNYYQNDYEFLIEKTYDVDITKQEEIKVPKKYLKFKTLKKLVLNELIRILNEEKIVGFDNNFIDINNFDITIVPQGKSKEIDYLIEEYYVYEEIEKNATKKHLETLEAVLTLGGIVTSTAKEHNISTNIRGSANALFSLYKLGVTTTNPLNYSYTNMFNPSNFMNSKKLPDIDLEYSSENKEELLKAIEEKVTLLFPLVVDKNGMKRIHPAAATLLLELETKFKKLNYIPKNYKNLQNSAKIDMLSQNIEDNIDFEIKNSKNLAIPYDELYTNGGYNSKYNHMNEKSIKMLRELLGLQDLHNNKKEIFYNNDMKEVEFKKGKVYLKSIATKEEIILDYDEKFKKELKPRIKTKYNYTPNEFFQKMKTPCNIIDIANATSLNRPTGYLSKFIIQGHEYIQIDDHDDLIDVKTQKVLYNIRSENKIVIQNDDILVGKISKDNFISELPIKKLVIKEIPKYLVTRSKDFNNSSEEIKNQYPKYLKYTKGIVLYQEQLERMIHKVLSDVLSLHQIQIVLKKIIKPKKMTEEETREYEKEIKSYIYDNTKINLKNKIYAKIWNEQILFLLKANAYFFKSSHAINIAEYHVYKHYQKYLIEYPERTKTFELKNKNTKKSNFKNIKLINGKNKKNQSTKFIEFIGYGLKDLENEQQKISKLIKPNQLKLWKNRLYIDKLSINIEKKVLDFYKLSNNQPLPKPI